MTYLPQEATRLFSVGEITVQYNPDTSPRDRVVNSRDAFQIFRKHWSEQINRLEEFYVLCLNRNNEAVGVYLVSVGGMTATYADPKIIYQVALGCHASSIIIAHNHPSGALQASPQDKDLTRHYQQIGKLLDCPLIDHLILSPDPSFYFSFADEGIL